MQYTNNQLKKNLTEMRNEKTKLMIRVLQIHMVRAKGTRKKPRLITTGPYNITTSENKIDIYKLNIYIYTYVYTYIHIYTHIYKNTLKVRTLKPNQPNITQETQ